MCIPIASIGMEISCSARMVDDLLSDLTYEVERELELEADAKKSAIRAAYDRGEEVVHVHGLLHLEEGEPGPTADDFGSRATMTVLGTFPLGGTAR